MKTDFYSLRKYAVSFLFLSFWIAFGASAVACAQNLQNLKDPNRQQLLNNLKLLVWSEPSNPNVMVKLRVHSGAAFDPKDKEGAMRLLADILFPDEQTRLFFAEELGGKLSVESNYDYLEITATGKSENFLAILDTIRNGVTNAPITPENFQKVRDARLKFVQAQARETARGADLIVRKQLFGEFFPYGRSAEGTAESIAKIERADLLQLRDRLLTADNATLAIIGNVDPKYAYRAVRQFFGAWQKADKIVPPTFRQPDAPVKDVFFVRQPSVKTAEIRFAVRGAARQTNYSAAQVAAQILQERWRKALPSELQPNALVRHEAHVLPGIVIFGASVAGGFAEPFLPAAQTALQKTLSAPVIEDEFNRAKTAYLAQVETDSKSSENLIELWLDADTFKIDSANLNNQLKNVSLAAVQEFVANWQKQTPVAVAITQAEGNAPAVVAPN